MVVVLKLARGYLLGGEASWAVIGLVVVCHRYGYGSARGSLKPFVPTIGMIPQHLRRGQRGNKNIQTESSIY